MVVSDRGRVPVTRVTNQHMTRGMLVAWAALDAGGPLAGSGFDVHG
ncbi:hypothetical protein ACLMAJ_37345 [Nocardia sp. KC 131]